MIVGEIGKGKMYYLMPNVLETVLGIWKLFRMLGMITLSNANIVCTNGMKAGVQIWHKLSTKIFESITYVHMFHSIKIQA
jgi:hypothetical protein